MYSVAFSPDSKLLVSVDPVAVRLWDVTKQQLITLILNENSPGWAIFSPDGKRLVFENYRRSAPHAYDGYETIFFYDRELWIWNARVCGPC